MLRKIKTVLSLIKIIITNPYQYIVWTRFFPERMKAAKYSRDFELKKEPVSNKNSFEKEFNPLREYFQDNDNGNGIFKWEHYFDAYHTHFKKFINKEVKILEIGIHSGGSLDMWRSYFGNKCSVYGIDIEEACKVYANDHTSIFVGDQEDRTFWNNFFEEVGTIDIIIDDGGHTTEQQRVTFEEVLPMLNPGGIYLCEDVHNQGNNFAEYSAHFIHEMNHFNVDSKSQTLESSVSKFQTTIKSMHFYPYLFVVEKNDKPITKLRAQRHGSSWISFLN